MFRKENLILSYAGGNALCRSDGFWAFVDSVRNVPNADLALVTHEMPVDVHNTLWELGVEIYDFHKTEYILRDRHLAFWQYLNEHGHKYRYILLSDCKDVVFQKNPFDWIGVWQNRFKNIDGNKDFLDDFVVLLSEGFKMSRSGFACIEHFEFEQGMPERFHQPDRDRWVINGGVSLGTPQALQHFEFLLWCITLKSVGRITDQATLNWVLRFLEKEDIYSVSHPHHDTLGIVCEGIKEGALPLNVKEGMVCNTKDEPYCIVHQWDRVEELKELVLSQYGR